MTTTVTPAFTRLAKSLTELVRNARPPSADELEQVTGHRVDTAGSVIMSRLTPRPETRLRDLADSLGLDPSTVSRQLPPLETAGLVERHPDPDDGRAALLRLTSAGLEASERIASHREERLRTLLADWTGNDLEELARLLERLAATMDTGR